MTKSKPHPSVEVHGVWAQGYTKAAAKVRAGELLDKLVERVEEGARLLRVHGLLVFVWPEKTAWATKVVDPATDVDKDGKLWGASIGASSVDEAVREGVHHAAHIAWSHEVASDRTFALKAIAQAGKSLPDAMHAELASDLTRYFAWQRDHRRLLQLGATAAEAHEHAGRRDGWVPDGDAVAGERSEDVVGVDRG